MPTNPIADGKVRFRLAHANVADVININTVADVIDISTNVDEAVVAQGVAERARVSAQSITEGAKNQYEAHAYPTSKGRLISDAAATAQHLTTKRRA